MTEDQEFYADGIGEIHFVGGMTRFDFVSVDSIGTAKKAPTVREGIRVIMPPEGFLNACEAMQELVDKLIEAGVLKKTRGRRTAGK